MKRVPKHWIKFEYYDPQVVLLGLQDVRMEVSGSDLSSDVKNLRTRLLQPEREAWDTAVFCYLLSCKLGLDIRFCRVEESDFDSVFTWLDNGTQCFAPVQMKELVPEYTNSTASLKKILAGLCKYGDSSDLVVGIKLNRDISIDFTDVKTGSLSVAEVWMFGATAQDQSKWSLFKENEAGWSQYEYEFPDAKLCP